MKKQSAVLVVMLTACRGATESGPPAPMPGPPPMPAPLPASAPAPVPSSAPASSPTAVASGAPDTWHFDGERAGSPPAGFSFGRTGQGRPGRWLVRAEADAPSAPNVLAQTDSDPTDYRFPVAVADAPSLRDLALSVRCKQVSGRVDQGCGLVFRFRDFDDYYLTRANALESSVCFYFVKGGRRQSITCWNGAVKSGVWHDYRVVAQGDHIEVSWDGAKVIDRRDATFSEAGKVGVWTKADSVIEFDDLSARALD